MKMRVPGLACLALVGSLAAAPAATIELDYIGQQKGGVNTYFRFDGEWMGAQAGEFTFKVLGTEDQIAAWCVDIAHVLIQSATPYAPDPGLFDAGVVANLDRLFTQHYHAVVDAVSSAAFQVAIWELIYDGGDVGLGAGRFLLSDQTPEKVRIAAQGFLDLDARAGGYQLSFLRSEASPVPSQNLVTVAPVPLPASVMLLLAGLGLMGAVGARRSA
ncbi:PEP-CTERM sorting domain-containing protein [Rhodovulum sp.]|uniref:PEP-CTERM sorting domain-containing protein n=1 Tax=Rhodovulum sp. TaxID=34009 RepID=UPI00257BF8EC|nr:PEP-CTERM sorting domain-containing protein [Rhodovulum sp.]